MLNYAVSPEVLQEFLPLGVELDDWNGRTYVSLVGFRFIDTRLMGIPIPFHRHFDEVNLRFYVRRKDGSEIKRGVVFIKEIVPKRAVTFVARVVYNENYVTMATKHRVVKESAGSTLVEYEWQKAANSWRLGCRVEGEPVDLVNGSEDEYITEHFWGYTAQSNGSTKEYHVDHPRWRVRRPIDAWFTGDGVALYGQALGSVLASPPVSAILAEGSAVSVYRGELLCDTVSRLMKA